jgi:pSer/pThr/pTyr-binding forkhead associated (FHA) protein
VTVFEVRGRGGQLLERFRSGESLVRIGRAFDNDIILEDRYVSPHHLRLARIEKGWRIEDLGSLNGCRSKVKRGAEPDIVRSGDRLRIGHTTLYVYDEDHPVQETLRLGGAEARLSLLGRATVWPILVVVYALSVVLSRYWTSYSEFKPLTMMNPILEGIMLMVGVAAFWALLGRLLRHKASFFAQLAIWLIYALLSQAAHFPARWVGYNFNSEVVEYALGQGLGLVLFTLTLWCSLLLATNLRTRGRAFAALGISVVLLGISVIGQVQSDREFSPLPDYYARLAHPALFWAAPVEQETLVDELTSLFDEADAEVIEDDSP